MDYNLRGRLDIHTKTPVSDTVIDLEFAHAKLKFYLKTSIMIIIGEQSSK